MLNRSKGKEQSFAAACGKIGFTLKVLVGEADIVMTCLPMPSDMEEIYLGTEGIVNQGRSGLTLIDFSTISTEDLNLKIKLAAERSRSLAKIFIM
ncbi:NAD(P)-binding domain-containing protein [Salipaludibacillus neizhouensis]|nr:NAD(P)-binding domain-containing protein [Salipaludibacillus neizhouensis]